MEHVKGGSNDAKRLVFACGGGEQGTKTRQDDAKCGCSVFDSLLGASTEQQKSGALSKSVTETGQRAQESVMEKQWTECRVSGRASAANTSKESHVTQHTHHNHDRALAAVFCGAAARGNEAVFRCNNATPNKPVFLQNGSPKKRVDGGAETAKQCAVSQKRKTQLYKKRYCFSSLKAALAPISKKKRLF